MTGAGPPARLPATGSLLMMVWMRRAFSAPLVSSAAKSRMLLLLLQQLGVAAASGEIAFSVGLTDALRGTGYGWPTLAT